MRRLLPVVGVLLCCLVAAAPNHRAAKVVVEPVVFAHPDEMVKGPGFIVLADRRVFTVMAFLNAIGYDEEAKGQQMHPVRVKVRKMVAQNLADHADKLRLWRERYKELQMPYFPYQDFALSLSADYPFRRTRPDSELTYAQTAELLGDLPETLNEFWVAAKLDRVWTEVKGDYIAEIRKYDIEKMRQELASVWQYLRMPRKDTFVLVNVPDLLCKYYQGLGAKYENYYYAVESPGASSHSLNIHEYLHSVVNPLVKADYLPYKDKLQAYYEAGKGKPLVATYQQLLVFTYECLVRALDHRLRARSTSDPADRKRIEDQLADQTAEGLTLAMPFYHLLTKYEHGGKSFDAVLPDILETLPNYKGAKGGQGRLLTSVPSEN
jgi:hypothetical protein